MIYVNALANDFKRRNICSLVSHWTNISCNAVWIWLTVHWNKWKRTLKKKLNKRTSDEALLILPLILQACKLREHIYPVLSTGAPSLEEQGLQIPPGHLARGTPGGIKPWGHMEATQVAHHLVHPKSLGKDRERTCSHKCLSTLCRSRKGKIVLCRALRHQSRSICAQLLPSPLSWYPLQKLICQRTKQVAIPTAPVIWVLCFRQLCQTI